MDDSAVEQEARSSLLRLLNAMGVVCSDGDLILKEVITRTGHPLYVVIGLNGTAAALSALTKKVAGRRDITVGAPGVFLLRPNDLAKLLTRILL